MRLIILLLLFLGFSDNPTKCESKIDRQDKINVVKLFQEFDDFSDSIKNILLKNGECYPASNIDEDIEVIRISIDSSNNAISVKSFYEQGGNGAITTIEYKLIEFKKGIKFFRSSNSGTGAFTNQDQFEVYNYNIKTSRFELLEDMYNKDLFNVEIKDFFFAETPDSIIREYTSHSSNFFILFDCNNGVAKNILVDNLMFNNPKDNKWIKGDAIRFDLKGNKFTRSIPYYESE